MEYKVGDRVVAVTDGGYTGDIEPGDEGKVTTIAGQGRVWVDFDGKTFGALLMYPEEIELIPQEPAKPAPDTKYRKDIADEVLAYADSIDEFVTHDDIYAGLVDLASEIRKGEWG